MNKATKATLLSNFPEMLSQAHPDLWNGTLEVVTTYGRAMQLGNEDYDTLNDLLGSMASYFYWPAVEEALGEANVKVLRKAVTVHQNNLRKVARAQHSLEGGIRNRGMCQNGHELFPFQLGSYHEHM